MRINKIEIENFKFFRKNHINLYGKNLLVFGENGSGKSSLYWALYTFFQSSMKSDENIQKYFDINHSENLLNKYCDASNNGMIAVELIDDRSIKTKYMISKDLINTNKEDTTIKEANLASDFINYRILSRLYDFRNSEKVDLFKLFKNDIFEYINMPQTNKNVGVEWQRLSSGIEEKITKNNPIYISFQSDLADFNTFLEEYILKIINNANKVLKEDFKELVELEILGFEKAAYDKKEANKPKKRDGKTHDPKITLGVKLIDSDLVGESTINKPHTHLNEAKLTAIALSIRLAVLKEKLSDSKLKVIILDDLLISLDMSHRLSVIDIVLKFMKDTQLIVMTHDKAFYETMNRYIENKGISDKWLQYEFKIGNNSPIMQQNKNNIDLAKDYYENYDYEACSNYLRKEIESILKRYLDPNLVDQDYKSLTDLLKTTQNQIFNNYIAKNKNTLCKLISETNLSAEKLSYLKKDFNGLEEVSQDDKELLNQLRTELYKFAKTSFSTDILEDDSEDEKLFKEVKLMIDRVLNPASHSSTAPLFKMEVEEAIRLVERLKSFLKDRVSPNANRNKVKKSVVSSVEHNISIEDFVLDVDNEIIAPIRRSTNTAELIDIFENKISKNISLIKINELKNIFQEILFRRTIKTGEIDQWLMRCYSARDNWSKEEKIIWGELIIALYDNNAIHDFIILSIFQNAKCISVVEEYDNYGHFEHQKVQLDKSLLPELIPDLIEDGLLTSQSSNIPF